MWLTENRTVDVRPTWRLSGVGAHFITSAPGRRHPSYTTACFLSLNYNPVQTDTVRINWPYRQESSQVTRCATNDEFHQYRRDKVFRSDTCGRDQRDAVCWHPSVVQRGSHKCIRRRHRSDRLCVRRGKVDSLCCTSYNPACSTSTKHRQRTT